MSIAEGLNKALNSNKTTTEIGIGGFVGFARVSESTQYTSTVPTEVLEDGSNAGDDIIPNPIVISIDGEVGDMMVADRQFPEVPYTDISMLGEITTYVPPQSAQQIQRAQSINSEIRDTILEAERIERAGQNVYDLFNGGVNGGKSDQQKFVDYMESVWFGGQLIEISTSYKNYKNMSMPSLNINRNNTDGVLKFSASFLQVGFTSVLYTKISEKFSSPANSVSNRSSEEVNNGGQNPETNESSLLSAFLN